MSTDLLFKHRRVEPAEGVLSPLSGFEDIRDLKRDEHTKSYHEQDHSGQEKNVLEQSGDRAE